MTIKLTLSALGAAIALCSCTTPVTPAPPHASPVPVGFQQLDKGLSQTFVTCQPCALPTPKTLQVTPPVAQPRPVPTARVPDGKSSAAPRDKETILSTTVRFAPASAALDPVAKDSLKTFCHSGMQLDGITVTGHTDSTGTPARNLKLARQRAKATSQYLRACAEAQGATLNVDEQVKGDCCYVASNDTPEGRALNRRVDVEQAPHAMPIKQADQ